MRTVAVALATLILALAMVPTPALGAGERVERVPYHLAAPGPFLAVEVPRPGGLGGEGSLHLGGETFIIGEGESQLEVFLLDASGRDVPGRIAFYDDGGDLLEATSFCFHGVVGIPEAATEVTVYTAATFITPEALASPCGLNPVWYGPATTGEIVATFT